MNCPKCNAQNADDAAFCAECGASLKEAAAPAATPAVEPAAAEPVAAAPAAKPAGWKKIVTLVGSICGLATVVLAFIFTFLIGVSIVEEGEMVNGAGIGSIGAMMEAIMDIMDSMGGSGSVNVSDLMSIMFQIMFTMYILFGFIIAMIVVVIKSIIRYVKEFRGQENKGVLKLTVGAYGFYALGAGLIYSLYAYSHSVNFLGETAFEGFVYNPATVAGLVLGALTLTAFLASRVVVQGKDLLKKSVMIPGIITLCTILVVAILWGLTASPMLSVSAEGETEAWGFLQLLGELNIRVGGSGTSDEAMMEAMSQMGTLLSGMVMQIIVLSLTAGLMIKNLRDLARKETKSGIALSVALVVFSIALMSVTASFNGTVDGVLSMAIPAVIMVMSLLALGLTITNKILRPKLAVKENIEQAQAPQA